VLTTDIEEDVSTNHLRGPNDGLAEEVKSSSNLTSSEDDWVEVKVPDTPVVENKNSSLPSRTDSNSGISKQVQ
jgi:hypothetical protein